MNFSFEKLEVYQKALDFAEIVYRITRGLPEEEKFGLVSQLRRASISIAANLAEGSGREGQADQKRFYTIARGSLYECIPFLELARRKSYLNEDTHQNLLSTAHELARLLNGLIRSRQP